MPRRMRAARHRADQNDRWNRPSAGCHEPFPEPLLGWCVDQFAVRVRCERWQLGYESRNFWQFLLARTPRNQATPAECLRRSSPEQTADRAALFEHHCRAWRDHRNTRRQDLERLPLMLCPHTSSCGETAALARVGCADGRSSHGPAQSPRRPRPPRVFRPDPPLRYQSAQAI